MYRLMILLVIPLWGCGSELEPDTDIDRMTDAPAQESWNVEFDIDRAGTPRLHLEAAYFRRFDNPDSLFVRFERARDDIDDRVTVVMYDSLGEKSARLTAERVRLNEGDRVVEASGDVVVTTPDARVLRCEYIRWDEPSETIQAPGFVTITTKDDRFTGYEFEASEDLETFRISRPTGTVVVTEPE